MGTHCCICLEQSNGTVKCISIHYDGYFNHVVPILRDHYSKRDAVEKLIHCGSTFTLSSPQELDDSVVLEKKHRPFVLKNKYELESLRSMMAYVYVFTHEGRWVCQVSDFIPIDQIQVQ